MVTFWARLTGSTVLNVGIENSEAIHLGALGGADGERFAVVSCELGGPRGRIAREDFRVRVVSLEVVHADRRAHV